MTLLRRFSVVSLILALLATSVCPAQPLQEKINRIVAGHRARIGVAIESPFARETAQVGAGTFFPMQSVYKFPIALAVLDRVDRGELALHQPIRVKRAELRPHTYSPLRDKYRRGAVVTMPLSEIVQTTLRDSDNNGCDILLRLAGGPENVTAYLRKQGIANMTVATTERAMHGSWDIQFTNRTTPEDANRLLRLFQEGALLKPDTHAFLWNAMKHSMVSPERLRRGLPPKTPFIHKTGTSTAFYRKQGYTLNDIGIVLLPDGKPVFVSVFVSHGKEPKAVTERMMARIARTTWEHFTGPDGGPAASAGFLLQKRKKRPSWADRRTDR